MALFGGKKKEKRAAPRRSDPISLGPDLAALDAVCKRYADSSTLAQPISIYKVMLRLDEGPGAGQVPDPGESEELAGGAENSSMGPGAEELFAQMGAGDRDTVGMFFSEMTAEKGQMLVAEGGTADSFYLIESGRVSYRVTSPDTGEPALLGELGGGEFFGEEALLGETLRPASIEALETTELKWVDSGALEIFVDQYPGMREILNRAREMRAAASVTHLLGRTE